MPYLLLFIIAILPVAVLLLCTYYMDKYQKEPIKSLLKAFFGGFLAVALDLILVLFIIDNTLGKIPGFNNTVFFNAFVEAGIPEELCKFLIFMIFIWRDKNFDEYFDGIVYAVYISLGFACVENIAYVIEGGMGTGIVRAILSVPAHFLFAVVMGYSLSLAKFEPKRRTRHLLTGLLLAMVIHGLFDWLLMSFSALVSLESNVAILLAFLIFLVFLGGDIVLWIFGIKLIRKHQKNSLAQAQAQAQADAMAKTPSDYYSNDPLN